MHFLNFYLYYQRYTFGRIRLRLLGGKLVKKMFRFGRQLTAAEEVVTDLLLHCGGLSKSLFEQFLLDVTQFAGVDQVGGCIPALNGRNLILQA